MKKITKIITVTFIALIALVFVVLALIKIIWNYDGIGLWLEIKEPEHILIANEPAHEPGAEWQPVLGNGLLATFKDTFVDGNGRKDPKTKNITILTRESVDTLVVNASHRSWCFSSPCHYSEGNVVTIKIYNGNGQKIAQGKNGIDYRIVKNNNNEQIFHIKLYWHLLSQSENILIVRWLNDNEFTVAKENITLAP